MGRVVGLMDDLFFQMKVMETAKHVGVTYQNTVVGDVLLGLLDPPTRLVVVDLNARSEPVATIRRLRATHKELPVFSFMSHVQTELASQAREAGATEVLPRSAFAERLAVILARAKE